jgi:hypothetical protein
VLIVGVIVIAYGLLMVMLARGVRPRAETRTTEGGPSPAAAAGAG